MISSLAAALMTFAAIEPVAANNSDDIEFSVVETVPDSQSHGTAWLNLQMAALAERHGGRGWNVTQNGLRWRRIAGDGSGRHPSPSDVVTVHYVGTFVDGREFDSSIARGEPASFPLNRVIKGWQEGVGLMGVGDKVEFAIPWQLGYGADGNGEIPGGATLLFAVELLSVDPVPD